MGCMLRQWGDHRLDVEDGEERWETKVMRQLPEFGAIH